jgi:ribosome-associated translation inhibitor RaiA
MLIEVNTDNHIQGRADVAASVQDMVADALDHFRERISRVEVHLGDENGDKGGAADIRCSLEARIEGHQPVGVTHHAGTVVEAVDGAAEKLDHVLERTLGRLRDRRPRADGSAADVGGVAPTEE